MIYACPLLSVKTSGCQNRSQFSNSLYILYAKCKVLNNSFTSFAYLNSRYCILRWKSSIRVLSQSGQWFWQGTVSYCLVALSTMNSTTVCPSPPLTVLSTSASNVSWTSVMFWRVGVGWRLPKSWFVPWHYVGHWGCRTGLMLVTL